MFPIERQQHILNILKEKKSVTVSELSRTLFIGEATIRRDLDKLQKKNLIKRTYGGAVLLEGLDTEIPLAVRVSEQQGAKDIIGNLASQLIRDGDIIIIDSSSTTLKMIPYLSNKKNITAITNGAQTAIELGENLHIKTYCTGGILRENSLSFIGQHARRCIENLYADKVFFSCRGLSMDLGLTDSSEEEAVLRRCMTKNSRKAILLCDSTKFDNTSFCKVMDFDCLHYLVTNTKPSPNWLEFLERKNIEVIYPDSSE